jgi:hypothetical protein
MIPRELEQLESLLLRALPDPRGFANRVLEQLLDRLANESPPGRPVTIVQPTSAGGLSEHSMILAAALGACECWGDDPDCELCGGAGSAGWTDPDETLYSEYVTPGVLRMATSASTDGQPVSAAQQLGAEQ